MNIEILIRIIALVIGEHFYTAGAQKLWVSHHLQMFFAYII